MKRITTAGVLSYISLVVVVASTPLFVSRLDPATRALLRGHFLLLLLLPLCILFAVLLAWQLYRQYRR